MADKIRTGVFGVGSLGQWHARIYSELEDAELRLARGERDAGWVFDELDRIEAEVQRVKVPLSFTDQLYQLRQHIDLVRHQVQTDTD